MYIRWKKLLILIFIITWCDLLCWDTGKRLHSRTFPRDTETPDTGHPPGHRSPPPSHQTPAVSGFSHHDTHSLQTFGWRKYSGKCLQSSQKYRPKPYNDELLLALKANIMMRIWQQRNTHLEEWLRPVWMWERWSQLLISSSWPVSSSLSHCSWELQSYWSGDAPDLNLISHLNWYRLRQQEEDADDHS